MSESKTNQRDVASHRNNDVASHRNNDVASHGITWEEFISAVEPNSVYDRLIGMIYGHALGDAVGLITEFKFKVDKHTIQFPYEKPIRDFPKCDWTDDTDHLIIVMQSLIKNRLAFNEKDIARRLKSWVVSGFPELGDSYGLGLGGTMSLVIAHPKFLDTPKVAAGEIWNNSGRRLASNGSLMRTSIIGALPGSEHVCVKCAYGVRTLAANVCQVTHADPRCVAACVFQSLVVHSLIYSPGSDVNGLMSSCTRAAQKYLEDDVKPIEIANVRHQPTPKSYRDPRFETMKDEFAYWVNLAYSSDITALELDEQVRIGFVLKCLGCSIFALQMIHLAGKHGARISFKKFITKIAEECGDADTNCAVAGATMGAHLGYFALPKDWIASLPNKDWLNSIIMDYVKVIVTEQSERNA